MVEMLWWIVVAICFFLSFIGLIFPLVPSVLVIWVGFLVYGFGIGTFSDLSVWFWSGMVIFTLFLILADIIASQYFVKRYGGSKWGERMAAIGVIVGSFIMPPFGIIFVPFILVFVTELISIQQPGHAFKVAIASLIAFLSSTVAKGLVQFIMIIWFIVEVFLA
ncbi:membrane protein [Alkalihalobacillus alcalophilus ATCC 27647 = CGMCC 1.3604]|uniref:Membrane protein n=1 Tax=Alkalihalobacillus alcalophilus ATCC 27647 = CGMCC 1.3604 TaxID=1218173 RepID=A0A094WGY2_ALKAL|nr:DUF456 domain-containing protein [Alkalihalobacillus alcalophilus]KGA96046.1 membrane protein [Alkalihalobacillus alcalophilus ATCC 27647 = CGMCC 1.3604]MED1561011.1 DUF456 domain-containing protein [Alkalihalobacillus alcalophilus]THG89055.1 membrane protein [Alkalihalobacillus alcalophilus ATCC 27647 = CGMCC 1.3604]